MSIKADVKDDDSKDKEAKELEEIYALLEEWVIEDDFIMEDQLMK